MIRLERALILGGLLLVLLVANAGIYSREQILREGRIVVLHLAPIDPRSLMQGDYMALRFKLADDVRDKLGQEQHDGYAIVAVDARGVGEFARVQDGPQPHGADEIAVHYRMRNGQVRLASNAFFFQEGSAPRFAGAKYGELRVGEDGTVLITGLRDAELHPL